MYHSKKRADFAGDDQQTPPTLSHRDDRWVSASAQKRTQQPAGGAAAAPAAAAAASPATAAAASPAAAAAATTTTTAAAEAATNVVTRKTLEELVRRNTNLITLENFDVIASTLATLVEHCATPTSLIKFVEIVFEKALTEPKFSPMYGNDTMCT